jgi:hypothetical protein
MRRELGCKTALADSRLSTNEHEPAASGIGLLERFDQKTELLRAAHESRGGNVRRSSLRASRRVEGRLMGENRALELLEHPARLEAELVDEERAPAAVRLERLRLPARPVQREHQLRAQAFPQRMLADERLELADHLAVASGGDVGFEAVLDCRQPQLLELRELSPIEELGLDIHEQRAAPAGERLA